MPDTIPSPEAPAVTPARTRGYFNRAQLDDLDTAESVLTAARANAAALAEQDIDAAYLDGFAAVVTETRQRAADSGQGGEEVENATALAGEAATALHTALQKIQSAAKQKHKMLAEDGDPATHFPTGGYLVGVRLNASRAILLQSADTLIARASEDSLPGFKTAEKITAVKSLLAAYKGKQGDQQDAIKEKELARLDRDGLVHVLNTRRGSIQHAADALWPWSDELHRPIRKTFGLPLTRPMGM